MNPWPVGTKCVITWVHSPKSLVSIGEIYVVGNLVRHKGRLMLNRASGGCTYNEQDYQKLIGVQGSDRYFHPIAWMRQIDKDPDTESLYDTKELENV